MITIGRLIAKIARHPNAASRSPPTIGPRPAPIADHRPLQPEGAAAGVRVGDLSYQRLHARRQGGCEHGLTGADRDEHRERRGEHRGGGADPEAGDGDDGESSGTDVIGDPAGGWLTDQHRDEVDGDEHTGVTLGDVELVRERRERDGDHRRVERHEGRGESDTDDGERRRAPALLGHQRMSTVSTIEIVVLRSRFHVEVSMLGPYLLVL